MKKNLAVIFGGRSSEHEVSCVSVVTIAKAVDLEKYNMFLIGITKDGEWKLVEDIAGIEDGSWKESPVSAIISPDTKGGLIISQDDMMKVQPIDVIFPVLHGMYGEDGTIQGLFEMADIPYVGCGVFASAASMDKFYTKLVVDTLGIRQAVYVPVLAEQLDDIDEVTARVEAKISYPVFVKPSKAGSSKGVSKADDRAALVVALKEAAKHDYKILVEETIVVDALRLLREDNRYIKMSCDDTGNADAGCLNCQNLIDLLICKSALELLANLIEQADIHLVIQKRIYL